MFSKVLLVKKSGGKIRRCPRKNQKQKQNKTNEIIKAEAKTSLSFKRMVTLIEVIRKRYFIECRTYELKC